MKTLFLGRHAKSSWDDSGLSDFERPLNDRGERDAPEMGRRLAQKHRTADLILCSAAVRARTTAAILAKKWGYEGDLLLEPKLYEASSSQMLDFIQELEDEATSALDAESERCVQDALDALIEASSITVLVVAHRLSTVRDADRICVMKRGLLVETGTHDDLFARDGVYADLVRRQTRLAKSDSQSLLSQKSSSASLGDAV